jgi:hypothetical protein
MKSIEARVIVSVKRWNELTEQQIAAWDALELRSLDQNIYLSPYFALPALRHLESSKDVLAVLIEEQCPDHQALIGFGLFETTSGTRRFPLPHLRALLTRHSFESSLLLDPSHAETAMSAFVDWCQRNDYSRNGIVFPLWPSDGGGGILLQKTCNNQRVPLYELSRVSRATLLPKDAGDTYIEKQLSASRFKDLRRRMRRLDDLGKVSWKAHVGADVTEEVIQRFLDLEDAGWKGEKKSSLKSTSGNEQFFRTMVLELANRNRAVFTEISIGDLVVASTSNFISGRAGFAFKLGWHPDYAKYSPGILSELELVRHAPELFSSLEYLDSGASEGSFMDELWSGRMPLAYIVIPTSRLGRFTLYAMGIIRKIKRAIASAHSSKYSPEKS